MSHPLGYSPDLVERFELALQRRRRALDPDGPEDGPPELTGELAEELESLFATMSGAEREVLVRSGEADIEALAAAYDAIATD